MPYVQVEDDVSVYYEDWGEGERYLLAAHIYIDYYCSYIRELAKKGYHVISVQLRGYGKSSRVPQTDDVMDHWIPDLLKVADHVGARKFIYTGISHGSTIGWQLIRLYPERIVGFAGVVCGPNFKGGSNAGSAARSKDAALAASKEAWERHCLECRDGIRNMVRPYMQPYWVSELYQLAEYEYGHSMEMDLQERTMAFGKGYSDNLNTEEALIDWMKTVQTPCIIFGGIHDKIIDKNAMLRTATYVPGCKLVMYQDSDHGVALCHGQDLLEEIDRFMIERNVFAQSTSSAANA